MPPAVLIFWLLTWTILAAWTSQPKRRSTTFLNNHSNHQRAFLGGIATFPFVAIITEPDVCHSIARMNETFVAIQSAVASRQVALVSIRPSQPNDVPMEEMEERVVEMIRRVVVLSQGDIPFVVVVSSDWTYAAVLAEAHGIHVKEHHQIHIADIRRQFPYKPVIGTSSHSVALALDAWTRIRPDYYFVGTCYETASHPEKVHMEGPGLPGQIKRALLNDDFSGPVFAIGGVDESNCDEPVRLGADGVATIRAILQSPDPKNTMHALHRRMSPPLINTTSIDRAP